MVHTGWRFVEREPLVTRLPASDSTGAAGRVLASHVYQAIRLLLVRGFVWPLTDDVRRKAERLA